MSTGKGFGEVFRGNFTWQFLWIQQCIGENYIFHTRVYTSLSLHIYIYIYMRVCAKRKTDKASKSILWLNLNSSYWGSSPWQHLETLSQLSLLYDTMRRILYSYSSMCETVLYTQYDSNVTNRASVSVRDNITLHSSFISVYVILCGYSVVI